MGLQPEEKLTQDYYSVPSEQTVAFVKSVAPYLSQSLKDIGSETTIEDIIKRVGLGSNPGGIQAVFTGEKEGVGGSYHHKWEPFVDFEKLYKDKQSSFEEQGFEKMSSEDFLQRLKEITDESRRKSMLADTIRLMIDPSSKETSEGVDRLLKGKKYSANPRAVSLLSTLYHELMHTPKQKFDEENMKMITNDPRHRGGPENKRSQYSFRESIKKHLIAPTAEVSNWNTLKGNKPVYVKPSEFDMKSIDPRGHKFKYEYESGYERDKNPEKAALDIFSRWFEQEKEPK